MSGAAGDSARGRDLERGPGWDIEWDDVVDVVCVGTSPGVLAYAVCCAAGDLDVMLIGPSPVPDEQTAAWQAAMTADLDAGCEGPLFSFARVAPPAVRTGRREPVEDFVGERLRHWSAHCRRSPFGLMFTQVPDLLVPMRTDCGQSVTAAFVGEPGDTDVLTWLENRARDYGLTGPGNPMAATIRHDGRIAGAELDGGRRVAATGGLVFAAGPQAAGPDPQGHPGCTLAVVGRPAGRFATVDLLRR